MGFPVDMLQSCEKSDDSFSVANFTESDETQVFDEMIHQDDEVIDEPVHNLFGTLRIATHYDMGKFTPNQVILDVHPNRRVTNIDLNMAISELNFFVYSTSEALKFDSIMETLIEAGSMVRRISNGLDFDTILIKRISKVVSTVIRKPCGYFVLQDQLKRLSYEIEDEQLKKTERVCPMKFINTNMFVELNDPYRFRLLLMGSNNGKFDRYIDSFFVQDKYNHIAGFIDQEKEKEKYVCALFLDPWHADIFELNCQCLHCLFGKHSLRRIQHVNCVQSCSLKSLRTRISFDAGNIVVCHVILLEMKYFAFNTFIMCVVLIEGTINTKSSQFWVRRMIDRTLNFSLFHEEHVSNHSQSDMNVVVDCENQNKKLAGVIAEIFGQDEVKLGINSGREGKVSIIQFEIYFARVESMVIEMNLRIYSSLALASKPSEVYVMKMIVKLPMGYTLDHISNDISKKTPTNFELSIDYGVTKIIRFVLENFHSSPPKLRIQVAHVGEQNLIKNQFKFQHHGQKSAILEVVDNDKIISINSVLVVGDDTYKFRLLLMSPMIVENSSDNSSFGNEFDRVVSRQTDTTGNVVATKPFMKFGTNKLILQVLSKQIQESVYDVICAQLALDNAFEIYDNAWKFVKTGVEGVFVESGRLNLSRFVSVSITLESAVDIGELLPVHISFSSKAKRAWGHIWLNHRKKKREVIFESLRLRISFKEGIL